MLVVTVLNGVLEPLKDALKHTQAIASLKGAYGNQARRWLHVSAYGVLAVILLHS